MRVKECLAASLASEHRAPSIPRRIALFTVLSSCSFTGSSRASDQDERQPLPYSGSPSEQVTFAENISRLEGEAVEAYARRDFKRAVDRLSELMYQQPYSARWSEMRAQVLVDGKNFAAAIMDYNEAMNRTPETDSLSQARLLAGRALALEGEEAWAKALADYEQASSIAERAGEAEDPFIVNSIGNCLASLGQWQEARDAYRRSAAEFQKASGFRDTAGLSAGRSTAASLAQSNAALALVQLGKIPDAIKELEYVSRRQGGFVDSRAALAALYYDSGRLEDAEKIWEYTCDNISVGCSKYRDTEWVRKVRRWPPLMSDKLQSFLQLSSQSDTARDTLPLRAVAAAAME